MATERNVVGIKFGVFGRGSISGDSGARILRQLTEIVDRINKEPPRFKIKLGIDQNFFKKQINALSKKINAQVQNIKITNTIGTKPGEGQGKQASEKEVDLYRELELLTKERYKAEEKLISLRHKGTEAIEVQKAILEEIDERLKSASAASEPKLSGEELERLDALNARLEAQLQLKIAIASHQDDQTALRQETSLKGLQANAEALLERYRDLIAHNKEAAQEAERLKAAMAQDISKEPEKAAEQIRNMAHATKEASGTFSRLTVESDTFFSKLRKAFTSKFFNTLSYAIIGMLTMALRQVYQNVIRLDKAMTELRIVTRKSDKTYADFAKSVTKTAKEIGASVEDLIKSTTVFARLGYSIPDAAKFAELATVYSKVAATNINEASKNITAVIKAFDVGANELERVLDQFVWIGNTFAITSEEIGIAMNNAASSLKANRNTLQQSLGLLTAANTTLQNINVSSTAVRTMAARISRSSAELTELGEDIGNVLSTARLDARMKEFGVAIVDANGELRSTFDILRDIAKIWDTLGTQDQAAVAEMVAGTRIQNAFYSIMQNWQDAEEIVNNAGAAVGSLQKAQEEYLDSIEGKVSQLKAAWEEFSLALLDSDLVKLLVDILKTVANIFNAVLTFGDGIIPTLALITGGVVLLSVVVKKLTVALAAQAAAHGTLGAAMAFHTKALLTNIAAGLKWMAKNPYVYLVVLIAMAMKAKKQWSQIVTVIVAGAIAIGIGIAMGVKIADGAIKKFMATNPIGWILLAITAVITAITALVKLISGPSLDDLKETAKESKEAWEALKSELDEVNSKLEETTDRIQELLDIAKRRQLSLVEQQELDRLTEYNAQLKQQQAILEAQERSAGDQAARDAAKVVSKVTDKDNLAGGAGFGRGFVTGLTLGISDLFGYGAIAESNKQNSLGGYGTDEDRVRRILADWSNATDEQKKFVEKFIGELREQEEQLTYYADATEQWQKDVNAAYNRVWESLDRYTLAASPDGFNLIWNSMLSRERFTRGTDALTDLANAGEVTSQSLRNLYDTNKDAQEFIDYLIKIGQFSWGSAQSIDALVKSVNELWRSKLFSVTKLTHVDLIEETQEGFDKLAKSLEDVLSLGVVSAANLKELLEHYEGLDRYFKRTSQGYVLGDDYADMSILQVLEKYASDSLQKYVDKLSLAQLQLKEMQIAADGSARSNEELRIAAEAVANAQENLNTAMETYAIHLRSQAIKEETEKLNKQRDALKEQLDAYKSLIDIRKDLLKSYKRELDYQKELAKRQKAVADIQTQLALARLDNSAAGRSRVRELEAELEKAQESVDDFTLERAIEVLTAQLDSEFKEYEMLIQGETDRIVEAINNLAKDLKLDMVSLVPAATNELWEDKYRSELTAAEEALKKAQTVKNDAQANVSRDQDALNTAKTNLDNVSGWDKFWNTKKNKNAKAAHESASSQLGHSQNVLKDAERELTLAQAELDRLNKMVEEIFGGPIRHSGGFVSDQPTLKSNETFAKLLKNEFVVTPQQMDTFMKKTLPAIALRATGSGGGGVNINSPLVNLSIENISKESLPDVERIVKNAVDAIKRELDSSFSRAGHKRSVNTFTVK